MDICSSYNFFGVLQMGAKYIDRESGEISYEPEFAKVYINDLCKVKGLNAVKHEMFKFMIRNMNNENVVSYGAITKKKFLDEHEIKSQTFNNNIKGMIESELIERIGKAEFRVNKKFAVKVEWSKVQSIEWKTTYSRDGKQEEVTIREV